MGFIAPALPFIAKGAAALGGALFGRKAQQSAGKRSPEEQVALSGAQNAASGLVSQGNQLIGQGSNQLNQSANFFSTLLSGNRAQQAQATAAPRAAITDVFRGAERGLERSGVRGAARDVASAELNRDRASQISSLVTGVQPAAAAALAGTGGQFLQAGAGQSQAGGSIFANLLGQGFQNRRFARGEGEKAGTSIGSLLFDVITGTVGRKRSNPGIQFPGAGGQIPGGNVPLPPGLR